MLRTSWAERRLLTKINVTLSPLELCTAVAWVRSLSIARFGGLFDHTNNWHTRYFWKFRGATIAYWCILSEVVCDLICGVIAGKNWFGEHACPKHLIVHRCINAFLFTFNVLQYGRVHVVLPRPSRLFSPARTWYCQQRESHLVSVCFVQGVPPRCNYTRIDVLLINSHSV